MSDESSPAFGGVEREPELWGLCDDGEVGECGDFGSRVISHDYIAFSLSAQLTMIWRSLRHVDLE